MARTREYGTETVVKNVVVETITCDKCGTDLDEEDGDAADNTFTNVLEIYLNQELCVHDRVRMDLCTSCLVPIWEKICEAIGADPEAELRIGQD